MKSPSRFLALPLALALAVVALEVGPVRGQFRPNRPGFPPQPRPGFNGGMPGMNPPGVPPGGTTIVRVWTCSGCKQEIGRGLLRPPATCPNCGARIVNGVGNGIPQPGTRGPFNPALPGGPMTPPAVNPPPGLPGGQPPAAPPAGEPPAFNLGDGAAAVEDPAGRQPDAKAPVAEPAVLNPPAVEAPAAKSPLPAKVNGPASGASSEPTPTPSSSSGGSSRLTVVVLVLAILAVGFFVLLGGTLLVIFTLKSKNPPPARRRRPENDYDD